MEGYIYMIVNMETYNSIRIGRTKSSDFKRPISQCSYLPFKTSYFVFRVENYIEIETQIHRHLKSYKTNGDWFNYKPQDLLQYILNEVDVLEYNFPSLGSLYKTLCFK